MLFPALHSHYQTSQYKFSSKTCLTNVRDAAPTCPSEPFSLGPTISWGASLRHEKAGARRPTVLGRGTPRVPIAWIGLKTSSFCSEMGKVAEIQIVFLVPSFDATASLLFVGPGQNHFQRLQPHRSHCSDWTYCVLPCIASQAFPRSATSVSPLLLRIVIHRKCNQALCFGT